MLFVFSCSELASLAFCNSEKAVLKSMYKCMMQFMYCIAWLCFSLFYFVVFKLLVGAYLGAELVTKMSRPTYVIYFIVLEVEQNKIQLS